MLWSPVRPASPRCPHGHLRRLLARALPHGLLLDASTLRPWASANFVGARHRFPCTTGAGGGGPLPSALQERLSAVEWRLPGHIVADLVVEAAGEGGLQIEILTVED